MCTCRCTKFFAEPFCDDIHRYFIPPCKPHGNSTHSPILRRRLLIAPTNRLRLWFCPCSGQRRARISRAFLGGRRCLPWERRSPDRPHRPPAPPFHVSSTPRSAPSPFPLSGSLGASLVHVARGKRAVCACPEAFPRDNPDYPNHRRQPERRTSSAGLLRAPALIRGHHPTGNRATRAKAPEARLYLARHAAKRNAGNKSPKKKVPEGRLTRSIVSSREIPAK